VTDYSRVNDFSAKDGLTTGNPSKLIKGSEVDDDFDAVVTAVATKANKVVPATTGNVASLSATGDLQDSGLAAYSAADAAALALAVISDTSLDAQTTVQINNMVQITAAAYAAESKDTDTLYVIVS
jgi:hypothetical protein